MIIHLFDHKPVKTIMLLQNCSTASWVFRSTGKRVNSTLWAEDLFFRYGGGLGPTRLSGGSSLVDAIQK